MNRKRFRLRQERGQGMVEFVIILPALVFILLAIIQFGGTYNHYISLTDGTRAGARKAAVSRSASDPVGDTKAAVCASASNLTCSSINITVTPAPPWSPGQQVTVKATYPYNITILSFVAHSGNLTSTTKERVE